MDIRNIAFIIFTILPASPCFADNVHKINGNCVDNFTNEPISGATAVLMTADSVALDTVITSKKGSWPNTGGAYSFSRKDKGRYIVKVSMVGYEDAYQPFTIHSKREEEVWVKAIRMDKSINMLPEVTATASKIKMVMRGDTVVYNADAFRLKDGSMLEELIQALPGTTIDDNGRIYVNGKYVESLLVNGRDFFNGNPTLALRNLPAYTVSKIKVYDDDGMYSRMMKRDMGDRKYTMDVRLKKEYTHGYLADAEAGIGTHSRYKARFLGMNSTEKDNFVAYAAANNLNEKPTSSRRGFWNTEALSDGRHTTKTGGLSYRVDIDKATRSYFGTSVSLSHENVDLTTGSNHQTFLDSGDQFQNTLASSKPRDFTLKSSNTLELGGSAATLLGDVKLTYSDNKSPSGFQSVISTATDSLNTTLSDALGKRKSFSVNGEFQGGIKILSDMLRYYVSTTYDRWTAKDYSLYKLDYLQEQAENDHRNKYTHAPNSRFTLNTDISYVYHTHAVDIIPAYKYVYAYNDYRSDLYRLDRVIRDDSAYTIGNIPDHDLLQQARDAANSYHSREHDNQHTVRLQLSSHPAFLGQRGGVQLTFPVRFSLRHIDYFRIKEYNLSKNDVYFDPEAYVTMARKSFRADVTARLTHRMPSMTDLIPYTDDSDPLNLRYGNPQLGKARDISLSGSYSHYFKRGMLSASVSWTARHNAVDYVSFTDESTGARMTRPLNADGNKSLTTKAGLSLPIGKKLSIKYNHIMSFYRNNDLTADSLFFGEDGLTAFHTVSNIIHNTVTGETVSTTYKCSSKITVGADINITFNDITSRKDNFGNLHTREYRSKVWANAGLPFKLSLSTDISWQKKEGLQDSQLDRNRWLWNLQLSREIVPKLLSARLYCYDILHQATNIAYTVDSKGRVETWHNTLPPYVMLTIDFKISKQPSRKGSN